MKIRFPDQLRYQQIIFNIMLIIMIIIAITINLYFLHSSCIEKLIQRFRLICITCAVKER